MENVNPKYFMRQGMQYSADPPQEEQGLYSVFKSDKSTWKVIRRFSKQLERQNKQEK
jgi:mannan endo-1,4-beta-mannosidase